MSDDGSSSSVVVRQLAQALAERDERLELIEEKHKDFEETLLHVFTESFNKAITNISIKRLSPSLYDEEVEFQATIHIDNHLLTLFMRTGPKKIFNNFLVSVGCTEITNVAVHVPTRRELDAVIYYNQQKSNEEQFILEMVKHYDRIKETIQYKPLFWEREIPRNYSGFYQVPNLLIKLEKDKPFLSEEQYTNTLNILNKVLADKAQHDIDTTNTANKEKEIISEEKKIYLEALEKYEQRLSDLCKFLQIKYFQPWRMDTITYMAERIDPRDLLNEDGELIDSLQDALSWQCNTLSEPDENGFRTIVDVYGKTRLRKLSPNIIHTDRFFFNALPASSMDNTNYWQKIYPDNTLTKYVFYAPPIVEVKEDFTDLRASKPKLWHEACKERGVKRFDY